MGKLQWKRVYDAPEESDGYRILIDRLWPRGMKKEAAELSPTGPKTLLRQRTCAKSTIMGRFPTKILPPLTTRNYPIMQIYRPLLKKSKITFVTVM